jgi:hypothetical protein
MEVWNLVGGMVIRRHLRWLNQQRLLTSQFIQHRNLTISSSIPLPYAHTINKLGNSPVITNGIVRNYQTEKGFWNEVSLGVYRMLIADGWSCSIGWLIHRADDTDEWWWKVYYQTSLSFPIYVYIYILYVYIFAKRTFLNLNQPSSGCIQQGLNKTNLQ